MCRCVKNVWVVVIMGLTNLILGSLVFPPSVDTIRFGGSEAFGKTQDSLFWWAPTVRHGQWTSEGIGWGREEWESELHVCTAPENAIPAVRQSSSPGAVRVTRTMALLSFPRSCSAPPRQVSKPPPSALKIQLFTLLWIHSLHSATLQHAQLGAHTHPGQHLT